MRRAVPPCKSCIVLEKGFCDLRGSVPNFDHARSSVSRRFPSSVIRLCSRVLAFALTPSAAAICLLEDRVSLVWHGFFVMGQIGKSLLDCCKDKALDPKPCNVQGLGPQLKLQTLTLGAQMPLKQGMHALPQVVGLEGICTSTFLGKP